MRVDQPSILLSSTAFRHTNSHTQTEHTRQRTCRCENINTHKTDDQGNPLHTQKKKKLKSFSLNCTQMILSILLYRKHVKHCFVFVCGGGGV